MTIQDFRSPCQLVFQGRAKHFDVMRWHAHRAGVGLLSYHTLDMIFLKQDDELLPAYARLVFFKNNISQYYHGWIQSYTIQPLREGKLHYKIKFVSPLYALRFSQTNRVFMDKSIPEILQQVFEQHSLILKNHLTQHTPKQESMIQYQETDFDFIMRLCHQNGLFFNEKQSSQELVYTLGDDIKTLCNTLSRPTKLHFYTITGMTHQSNIVFDVQAEYNTQGYHPATQRTFLKTEDSNLLSGQIIELIGHPIVSLNKHYLLITIEHHFGQNNQYYWNRCEAITLDASLNLFIDSTPRHLILPAVIDGPKECDPTLDDQGRYCVHFYFDTTPHEAGHASAKMRRVQPYGGPTKQKTYGIHFPLKQDTEVAIGFQEGCFEKSLILGTLSHPFTPNVVTQENELCYRLRTTGGNELILDDTPHRSQIDLHTLHYNQRLLLNAEQESPFMQLSNQTGSLEVFAQSDLKMISTQDQYYDIQKDWTITVGQSQILTAEEGSILLDSGNNIHLSAQTGMQIKTAINDISLHAKNINLVSETSCDLSTQEHDITLQTTDKMHFEASQITLLSGHKIDFNDLCTLRGSHVHFKRALCQAPQITLQPAISSIKQTLAKGTTSQGDSQHKKQHKKNNLFDLIALNFREERQDEYFRAQFLSHDPYRKTRLSPQELDYFIQHDRSVTIFIHGYNVAYGDFGETIQTHEIKQLDQSRFKRRDLYRDPQHLKRVFPDATVGGRKIGEDSLYTLSYDRILNPTYKPLEALLNGDEAHAWWLRMEWNLNDATGQLDTKTLQNYVRLLHIAWQGDPTLSIDYMAAESMADHITPKIISVFEQLIVAGLHINVIAHSLGCRILLKIMDHFGHSIQHQQCLQHVFLWQPAVSNDALYTEFPKALQATHKMTILYSQHDHVLGPVKSRQEIDFWRKMTDPSTGFMLAICAGVIYLIDRELETQIHSPYHLAQTLRFPITDFLQKPTLRHQFYREWINTHQDKRTQHTFYSSLRDQEILIKKRYSKQYQFLVEFFDAIQSQHYHKAYALGFQWFCGLWYENDTKGLARYFKTLKQLIWVHNPLRQFVSSRLNTHHQYSISVREFATLLITVLTSSGAFPKPAMGYQGPDLTNDPQTKKLYEEEKLILVDQGDLLIDHSAMKIPTAALMKQIYQIYIVGEKGLTGFGVEQQKSSVQMN